MKLIDKAAVVAEIERRRESNTKERYFGRLVEDNYFLDFINTLEVKEAGVDFGDPKGDKSAKCIIDTKTLEVKEVDLEEEVDVWRHNHFHGRRDKNAAGEYLERSSQLDIARYFFELGLSVSNKV